jgi:hypothetical protein
VDGSRECAFDQYRHFFEATRLLEQQIDYEANVLQEGFVRFKDRVSPELMQILD